MAVMPASTGSRAEAAEELRTAMMGFFAAQRRLRGRDTKRGGLTFAQWQLVRCLAESEDLPASRCAAELALTPATVTQSLDHLAELGLVERVRSESDRRVVLNRLTPKGRDAVAEKQTEMEGRWADALADLTPEQLVDGAQLLRRMADVLDGM
jgi:DNA-binding MarR family transcriptional regulator